MIESGNPLLIDVVRKKTDCNSSQVAPIGSSEGVDVMKLNAKFESDITLQKLFMPYVEEIIDQLLLHIGLDYNIETHTVTSHEEDIQS